MSLQDAVDVLSDQAAGRPLTNKSKVIAAALALDTAALKSNDRDLLDAAAGLHSLAAGGELTLNQVGRERAAHLAIGPVLPFGRVDYERLGGASRGAGRAATG